MTPFSSAFSGFHPSWLLSAWWRFYNVIFYFRAERPNLSTFDWDLFIFKAKSGFPGGARKWSRSVVSNSLWPHGHQAPPSMGFSRQEYWSGVLLPSVSIKHRKKFCVFSICKCLKYIVMYILWRGTSTLPQGYPVVSCLKKESEVAQSCPTLCDPMDTRLLHPWDFLGKSTGVGCHFFLQGIFPTQGSNPGLLHCRQTFYRLSHQGSNAQNL